MPTWIRWAIPCATVLLAGCVTNYPAHTVRNCGTDYTVTGSIRKKCHRKREYRLTVKGPGRPKRTIHLGDIPNDYFRAILLSKLKDSLHKADLFPPCSGQSGENDRQLDGLIKLLIKEPFPYSHDIVVAVATIDDNNVLKLLKQSALDQYQLIDEHVGRSTVLVKYDDTGQKYAVEWDTTKNDALLVAHFDQWLALYYQIPATAVKPELLIASDTGADGRSEIIARSAESPDASPTGVKLSKAVAEEVRGSPETEVKINVRDIKVKPVIDPNHPSKKTVNAPKLFERSN